jgi:hypothetical protein
MLEDGRVAHHRPRPGPLNDYLCATTTCEDRMTTIEQMTDERNAKRHREEQHDEIVLLRARVKNLAAALETVEEDLRRSPHAGHFVQTLIVARRGLDDERMGWLN